MFYIFVIGRSRLIFWDALCFFVFEEKSDLWQEIQRAAAGCAVVFGAGRKRSERTEHQGETPGGVSGSVCRHSAGTSEVQFCFLFFNFIWFLAWRWNLSLSPRKLSKMRSCFHCSLCWRSWIWLASWVRGRSFFSYHFLSIWAKYPVSARHNPSAKSWQSDEPRRR